MKFAKIANRWKERDDKGITLVELAVGIFIFGLVTVIIFNIFQTTNATASNVRSGTTSIATAQTVTAELTREVRNAAGIKVATNGNRLDIITADDSCMSWVFYENSLYSHRGDTGPAFEAAAPWKERINGVERQNSNLIFALAGNTLNFSFKAGEKMGKVGLEGETFMRVKSDVTASPCFGDTVGEEIPEPSEPEPPVVPEVITYNITYDLVGGTAAGNPDTYTNESSAITLSTPSRDGYEFAGWTGTGLSSPTINVVIPAGAAGHRSYTATWNEIIVEPEPEPEPETSELTATIQKTNSWGNTYQWRIVITNNGSTPTNNGWIVAWAAPGANNVTGWESICGRMWGHITCVNQHYNKIIPAGGSVVITGQIDGAGQNIPATTVVSAQAL